MFLFWEKVACACVRTRSLQSAPPRFINKKNPQWESLKKKKRSLVALRSQVLTQTAGVFCTLFRLQLSYAVFGIYHKCCWGLSRSLGCGWHLPGHSPALSPVTQQIISVGCHERSVKAESGRSLQQHWSRALCLRLQWLLSAACWGSAVSKSSSQFIFVSFSI